MALHDPTCNATRLAPKYTPGSGCSCTCVTKKLKSPFTRFCCRCQDSYTGGKIHCPACLSTDTYPIGDPSSRIPAESAPVQETLFTLPPPPRAVRWGIEWRWKGEVWKKHGIILEGHHPENDWRPIVSDWTPTRVYKVTTERQAVNRAARLRKESPGKSFRVVPVEWAESDVWSPSRARGVGWNTPGDAHE